MSFHMFQGRQLSAKVWHQQIVQHVFCLCSTPPGPGVVLTSLIAYSKVSKIVGKIFVQLWEWNKILNFDSCKKDQGLACKPEDLINRKYKIAPLIFQQRT